MNLTNTQIEEILSGKNRDELIELSSKIQRELSQQEVEKSRRKPQRILITNFYDKEVNPYDKKCTYEVFCKENKEFTFLNGLAIQGFFGLDDEAMLKFEAKKLGTDYEKDGLKWRFVQYETSGYPQGIPSKNVDFDSKVVNKNVNNTKEETLKAIKPKLDEDKVIEELLQGKGIKNVK